MSDIKLPQNLTDKYTFSGKHDRYHIPKIGEITISKLTEPLAKAIIKAGTFKLLKLKEEKPSEPVEPKTTAPKK